MVDVEPGVILKVQNVLRRYVSSRIDLSCHQPPDSGVPYELQNDPFDLRFSTEVIRVRL